MSEPETTKSGPVSFEETEPGVGLITIRRPDKLNALNIEVIDAFDDLYVKLSKDENIRLVILTGEGRGFSSGADLAEAMANKDSPAFASPENFLRMAQERYGDLIIGLHRIPQPVIAAVNGPAAGGGMCLALAADIRIAAPEAYFVASFINIGLSAGELGVSYFLPRMVGMSRAAEILFTGRRVGAEEAERIGLVSKVVPKEELLPEAYSIAKTLLQKSQGGLTMTKKVLASNASAPSLEAAIELENRNQTILVASSMFFQKVGEFTK